MARDTTLPLLSSAPSDFGITVLTRSVVKLSWNPGTDAVSYQVERKAGIDGLYEQLFWTSASVCIDSLQSSPMPYYYRVKSLNRAGQSEFTGEDSIKSSSNSEWILGYSGYPAVTNASGGGYVVGFVGIDDVVDSQYLLKLDEEGNQIWTSKFGYYDMGGRARRIIQATGGGYIVLGEWQFAKIDENGNRIWSGQEIFISHGGALAICPTNDGGYLLGSQGGQTVFGDDNLIKIDLNGQLVWHKNIDVSKSLCIYDICVAANDGFVIAGVAQTPRPNGGDGRHVR